jgi:putative ABC transport system permease protein
VALAFVLLTGAGLLIQTFLQLRAVDVGCRTENVLTLRMPPSIRHSDPARIVAYQRDVLGRVRALPGVLSAGFTNHIPLVIKGDITGIGAEGHEEDKHFQCRLRVAGPGYLQTMGIPVLRGRDIEERDVHGAQLVVLINSTLARTLWPDAFVGKRSRQSQADRQRGKPAGRPLVGGAEDDHEEHEREDDRIAAFRSNALRSRGDTTRIHVEQAVKRLLE